MPTGTVSTCGMGVAMGSAETVQSVHAPVQVSGGRGQQKPDAANLKAFEKQGTTFCRPLPPPDRLLVDFSCRIVFFPSSFSVPERNFPLAAAINPLRITVHGSQQGTTLAALLVTGVVHAQCP